MNKKLKQMKKRLCAAGMVIAAAGISVPAAVGALSVESVYAAGDVAINVTNFPDENFRKYVSENIDKDGDGKLSEQEIEGCEEIKCNERGITSLKGIEYFTALKGLYCIGNKLSSLDVSKNVALVSLVCPENNLSSLDVSKNVALVELHCIDNNISRLDVSKNMVLEEFHCSKNNLSSLDVSKNVALKNLGCANNNLRSLDVSKNVELYNLYCSENNLSSLDVSKNVALKYLFCSSNNLSSLDVSKNVALEILECDSNNLSNLDVSKNVEIGEFFCDSQSREITVVGGTIALSAIDPNLKASAISNLKGATLSGDKLTNITADTVTYDYATGYNDQKMDVTLNVKKEITPESVSIDKKLLVLDKGKSGKLTATVKPDNAKDKTITWSSSNTSVAKVDNTGNVTAVNHGTAKITAKTSNGKTTECEVRVNFIDVNNAKEWYYKPVYWAAENGITTGTDGKFFPADICTREQAITFLWRMEGKPQPKNMTSWFSDVKDQTSYSYKAIMWGAENDIITGSWGGFFPINTCTREQIVTMIWRLAGKPEPKNMNSKFKDVTSKTRYSYKAVMWAAEKGITTGTNGLFYPTGQCKRREIVTFIYRYKN